MTIVSTLDRHLADIEPAASTTFSQPTLDRGAYRDDLAALNLTDAQEAELLEALWTIMGAFARMGYSVDVCGLIFEEFNEAASSDSGDAILPPSTSHGEANEGEGGSE